MHSEVQHAPARLTPVAHAERIVSLDVLRGVAILGIFLVNIAFFSGPLAQNLNTAVLADVPLSEQLAWGFMRVFAELKFISLFSLLFGIGLVVQMNRAAHAGRSLGGTFIRRLLVLLCIGLIHGLLIWYGDILTLYAVGGLVLFLFRNLSGRILTILACVALTLGTLQYAGIVAMGVLAESWQPGEAELIADADPAADRDESHTEGVDDRKERWDDAQRQWAAAGYDVTDESFGEMEMIAYGEGPMVLTIAIRSMMFAGHFFMAGVLGGFAWRVLAMFLFGAALMKWGFFSARFRTLHWRLLVTALPIGLILELTSFALYVAVDFQPSWGMFLAEIIHWLGSLVLMFGYVGGVCTLVHSGALHRLTAGFAAVGRMALTNYLLQSVVATYIMYWWGLGLFGELSRVQQVALVFAIFAGQIALSLLWLSVFRFGPMEWLWRTLTYLKWQPLLRERA